MDDGIEKDVPNKVKEKIDKNGCCVSCGEYWCDKKKECLSTWEKCELGYYDATDCTFTYNATGYDLFSYDLKKFESSNFYKILDMAKHPKETFNYYFNLCAPVKQGLLPDVCNVTSGTGKEVCDRAAMAYQYEITTWGYETCYRLSDCFDDGPGKKISENVFLKRNEKEAHFTFYLFYVCYRRRVGPHRSRRPPKWSVLYGSWRKHLSQLLFW